MYHFAVIALLGLATLKVTDLLEDLVPAFSRFSALLRLAVGVAAAVAIDYSVFKGFGIDVRNEAVGTWATGLMIGSIATAWRAALGYLGSSEGDATESHRSGRPRMAA